MAATPWKTLFLVVLTTSMIFGDVVQGKLIVCDKLSEYKGNCGPHMLCRNKCMNENDGRIFGGVCNDIPPSESDCHCVCSYLFLLRPEVQAVCPSPSSESIPSLSPSPSSESIPSTSESISSPNSESNPSPNSESIPPPSESSPSPSESIPSTNESISPQSSGRNLSPNSESSQSPRSERNP
ncbi:pectinesterase inhibitor 10 [Spinacia oleracea]|uniref:Pectinesterase inhibitor 10 n=1 Tax=Spinacia oleracea TaxID=3562 RepID=A0ABM3RES2_SPIOL|nr:pectinesterase inhibitor 10-like [Spinacia oleracea]